jgi:hypothetical protein
MKEAFGWSFLVQHLNGAIYFGVFWTVFGDDQVLVREYFKFKMYFKV